MDADKIVRLLPFYRNYGFVPAGTIWGSKDHRVRGAHHAAHCAVPFGCPPSSPASLAGAMPGGLALQPTGPWGPRSHLALGLPRPPATRDQQGQLRPCPSGSRTRSLISPVTKCGSLRTPFPVLTAHRLAGRVCDGHLGAPLSMPEASPPLHRLSLAESRAKTTKGFVL